MKTSLFRTGTPRFIVIDPPPSLSDRIADTEIESLRHSVTAPYMKGQPDIRSIPREEIYLIVSLYYDDNRDEYDSYEDAYEGFLDYESSWDDY